MNNAIYNPIARQREKQLSREQDAADIASGRKTREQVTRENSMFPEEMLKRCVIDWDSKIPLF